MINGVDYAYYWQHPEKYPRMKDSPKGLDNYGVVRLVEGFFENSNEYLDSVILEYKKHPKARNARMGIFEALLLFGSDRYRIFAMGQDEALKNQFLRKLGAGFDEIRFLREYIEDVAHVYRRDPNSLTTRKAVLAIIEVIRNGDLDILKSKIGSDLLYWFTGLLGDGFNFDRFMYNMKRGRRTA